MAGQDADLFGGGGADRDRVPARSPVRGQDRQPDDDRPGARGLQPGAALRLDSVPRPAARPVPPSAPAPPRGPGLRNPYGFTVEQIGTGLPGRGTFNRVWRGDELLGRVVNETRYPQGTVRQERIKYRADHWTGREFVTLPGLYESLEQTLIAFTTEG
jgi:hypothetical protein